MGSKQSYFEKQEVKFIGLRKMTMSKRHEDSGEINKKRFK